LSKINALTLAANDNVYLKAGEVWREQLTIDGSGSSGNRITVTSYGAGVNPKILLTEQVSSWSLQSNNVYNAALPGSAEHSKGMLNAGGTDLTDTYVIFSSPIEATWFDQTSYNENDDLIWFRNTGGDPGTREVGVRRYGVFITGDWITIDGIDVDGPPGGDTADTSYMSCMFIQGRDGDDPSTDSYTADNVTIQNCTVRFSRQFGIFYRNGATNAIVQDNTISNCAAGVGIYVNSDDAIVRRNFISDTSTHNGDIGDRGGVSVNNSDDPQILDNLVDTQGVDDHVTTAEAYGVSPAQDCAITLCCGVHRATVARNKVIDFAQCGINYGLTGGSPLPDSPDGDADIYNNVVDGGGGTKIREPADYVAGIRIGGGGTGTALTNNHGDVNVLNNFVANVDATSSTQSQVGLIVIRNYYMDNIRVSNNTMYRGGENANITYALYINSQRHQVSRSYTHNNVYETSGFVVYQSGLTYAYDDIASFNAVTYASDNIVENPQISSYSATPGVGVYILTADSSVAMRTGGFDPCGGVYSGCDFDDAPSPSRIWGTNTTQQKWSTSDSGGFGRGPYPYAVVDNPPTVTITQPTGSLSIIDEADTLTFFSNITDDEDDTSTLTVAWDLDGDSSADSFGSHLEPYTYATAGTFVVTVTVTDSAAQTDTDTHTVQVDAAASTWSAVYTSTNFGEAPVTTQDVLVCEVFSDADLVDGPSPSYDDFRATFDARYGSYLDIISASVCKQAAGGDPFDCASTPTRLTFGAANSVVIPANTNYVSDNTTFTWDGSTKIIVHVWLDDFTLSGRRFEDPITDVYFKGGATLTDETVTQNVSDYVITNTRSPIVRLEGKE
jgi:hypothetical protein